MKGQGVRTGDDRGLCFHQGAWLPVQLVRNVLALMQLYQKDLKVAMMEELGLEKEKEPAGGGEAEAAQPTHYLTKHFSKFGKGPKRSGSTDDAEADLR